MWDQNGLDTRGTVHMKKVCLLFPFSNYKLNGCQLYNVFFFYYISNMSEVLHWHSDL